MVIEKFAKNVSQTSADSLTVQLFFSAVVFREVDQNLCKRTFKYSTVTYILVDIHL